jgi:hypothetical protein
MTNSLSSPNSRSPNDSRVNSHTLSRIQRSHQTIALSEQISSVHLPNKGTFPYLDTSISLLFLSFVSSGRLKSFALFLLDLTLGRILPHTPYVHSSTLGLKWFSVSVFLAESLCIRSLYLLSFNRLHPPRDSERLGGSICVHETMPKVDELTVRGSSLSPHMTQAFTSIKHIPSI